jgi:hypothetical protein
MTISASGRLSERSGRMFGVVLLGGVLFSTHSPGDAVAITTNPEAVTTVPLRVEEVQYSFLNWGVSVITQSEAFQQEPVADGKIHRGELSFAGSRSNAIPFLWQRNAGKLHLDLNRNRDLTDDADGVFVARESKPGRYQTFANVRVPVETASGVFTQLMDLSFWDYSTRPNATAALRSFWQGRVALNGTDWQVGVVQSPFERNNHPGYLLFRPWERRDKPFNVGRDGSLEAANFPKRVFVGGQLYQCEFKAPLSGQDTARLELAGQTVPLGELRITGQFIRRMTLEGGDNLVILDQPAGTARVPVGSYSEARVWLHDGNGEAFRESARRPSAKRLVIAADRPAQLMAGGPLTNSVEVTRRGGNLLLNYKLIGADGDAYQMSARDNSRPPEFIVFSGDQRIATGKFEFG